VLVGPDDGVDVGVLVNPTGVGVAVRKRVGVFAGVGGVAEGVRVFVGAAVGPPGVLVGVGVEVPPLAASLMPAM
jgi:hypothetical protein